MNLDELDNFSISIIKILCNVLFKFMLSKRAFATTKMKFCAYYKLVDSLFQCLSFFNKRLDVTESYLMLVVF